MLRGSNWPLQIDPLPTEKTTLKKPGLIGIKDTHREKLFDSFRNKNDCLAASNLFHMFTQSI